MQANFIYEKITATIIEKLENGVVPWRKTWAASDFQFPMNGITKRHYSGCNMYLCFLPYASNKYYTFNQIAEIGGSIKKGEKGNMILYWNFIEKEIDNEKKKIPFLRYYMAWNQEQLVLPEEYMDKPVAEREKTEKNIKAEKIIAEYMNHPEIIHGGEVASYRPNEDVINMPNQGRFYTDNDYYATLFHELVHSTGAEKRLNRLKTTKFGSTEYSKEELVAEIGASFLCGVTGIENTTIDNSASYIASWLKALKNDNKMFLMACNYASKAVDYMRGKTNNTENDDIAVA